MGLCRLLQDVRSTLIYFPSALYNKITTSQARSEFSRFFSPDKEAVYIINRTINGNVNSEGACNYR